MKTMFLKGIVCFLVISSPLLAMKRGHSLPGDPVRLPDGTAQHTGDAPPGVSMTETFDYETSSEGSPSALPAEITPLNRDCPICHKPLDFLRYNRENPLIPLHFNAENTSGHFAHKYCFEKHIESHRHSRVTCPIPSCSTQIFIKSSGYFDLFSDLIWSGIICYIGLHLIVYAGGYTVVFYEVPWATKTTLSIIMGIASTIATPIGCGCFFFGANGCYGDCEKLFCGCCEHEHTE